MLVARMVVGRCQLGCAVSVRFECFLMMCPRVRRRRGWACGYDRKEQGGGQNPPFAQRAHGHKLGDGALWAQLVEDVQFTCFRCSWTALQQYQAATVR